MDCRAPGRGSTGERSCSKIDCCGRAHQRLRLRRAFNRTSGKADCGVLLVVWDGFLVGGFLNRHVLKLFGVKDFATLHALDVLGVVVPGDNSYPGMFAGGRHRIVIQLE